MPIKDGTKTWRVIDGSWYGFGKMRKRKNCTKTCRVPTFVQFRGFTLHVFVQLPYMFLYNFPFSTYYIYNILNSTIGHYFFSRYRGI